MQTSSHVEKDSWFDLGSKKQIINIRTKGTYKPLPKPGIPKNIIKPCNMDNPVCPIDNQPLPVPCNLCPVNDMINENNQHCNNCQHNNQTDIENTSVYGSNITEIDLSKNEPITIDEQTIKKTSRKTTARKTKKVNKEENIITDKSKKKTNRGRKKVTD